MDAPSGDKFTGLELALAVMLAASVVVQFFTARLIPLLALSYEDLAMEMSLPTRIAVEMTSWPVTAVAFVVLLWTAISVIRPTRLGRLRRAVLIVTSVAVTGGTLFGLYLLVREGAIQTIRLSDIAQLVLVERDITSLDAASEASDKVIAVLDPGRTRDFPQAGVRNWGAPMTAIQLADAYARQGDVEAARRIYGRARESAALLDQMAAERTKRRRVMELGTSWGPSDDQLKQLPALVRSVADRRLAELDKASARPSVTQPSR